MRREEKRYRERNREKRRVDRMKKVRQTQREWKESG